MAYCLDSYELVRCPECAAKVAYNDKDIFTSTKYSYDPIFCENSNVVKRIIKCPKCYLPIEVEKLEPFTIGVDLAKEKDMGGISW